MKKVFQQDGATPHTEIILWKNDANQFHQLLTHSIIIILTLFVKIKTQKMFKLR